MQLWLYLPEPGIDPGQLAELAVAAERAGFDGLALMDHLVTPVAEDRPVLESMALAAWLAARTDTLRLGHLVLCDAMRHPAVLAKAAVTIDHLSGGRFELGLGWGSWAPELVGFDITRDRPAQRVARLEHSLAVITALWAGEPAVDDGKRQVPLPLRRIPILVGGAGPRTLALAREYADWWNLPAPDVDRLDELRPQAGAARSSVQLAVKLVDDAADADAARQRIVQRMGDFGAGLVVGGPAAVATRIDELTAAGVERIYLWPLGRLQPTDIENLSVSARGRSTPND